MKHLMQRSYIQGFKQAFLQAFYFNQNNPKYTLREVIVYHYRFLSSKAYQNTYQVIRIGPVVPGSISWFVDVEVLDPGSQILGTGFWVPGPHFRLCLQKNQNSQPALIGLIEEWREYLDKDFIIGAILTELSKAFDCFPRSINC